MKGYHYYYFFPHDETSFESLSRWSPALPLPLPTRENHRCGTNGETGHKQVRDPCLRIRHPAPPQPCLPQRNGDRSRPARMPPGPVHWCQMSADPRPLASAFAGMTSSYPGPAWKQDAESPRTIAVVSKVGAAGAPGRGRYRGLCRGQLQKASMLCFSRMFSLSVCFFFSVPVPRQCPAWVLSSFLQSNAALPQLLLPNLHKNPLQTTEKQRVVGLTRPTFHKRQFYNRL